MTEFEFVFVLYSLVMGLSLVELLAGLGRTLELKLARDAADQAFRIGWLTPLLAVFVILDLLSFWMFAWPVQRFISANTVTVLGVLVFSGSYYLASRLVFPSHPESFSDLDTHYLRVRRIIFGMLIVMVLVQWAFIMSNPALAKAVIQPVPVAMTAVLLVLMIAAGVTGNRKASTVILSLLIARYLLAYLL